MVRLIFLRVDLWRWIATLPNFPVYIIVSVSEFVQSSKISHLRFLDQLPLIRMINVVCCKSHHGLNHILTVRRSIVLPSILVLVHVIQDGVSGDILVPLVILVARQTVLLVLHVGLYLKAFKIGLEQRRTDELARVDVSELCVPVILPVLFNDYLLVLVLLQVLLKLPLCQNQ
mgnify:FL=1